MRGRDDLEERVRRLALEAGCGVAKVVVSEYFPGIAAIPWLNLVLVSRAVARSLSDEHLRAILAHEAYHLTMIKDRRRLLRNLLTSACGYMLLVDVVLLITAVPLWLLINAPLPDNLLYEILAAILAAFIILAVFPYASLIVRRLESRLMRWIPFGAEEAEANAHATRVVGEAVFVEAVIKYSEALRNAVRDLGLLGRLFMNSIRVAEAVNPHPMPGEVMGSERRE